jgi:small-conductance mechanosensitive channel
LDQETIINIGTVLVNILLTLLAAAVTLALARRGFREMERREVLSGPLLQAAHTILRWTVWIVLAMLVLQQIGVSINNVWTMISAVVAMIAIGFVAVWSVLSNLLCTVMLIIFHPFRVGDEIEIIDPAMTVGISGRVRNINLMFTTLMDTTAVADGPVIVQVPNNLLFQKIIRRKGGDRTFSLDRQLFEPRSLLRANGKNHLDNGVDRESSTDGSA